MSSSRGEQKRRITKNEKIAELQSKLKILADENKRLKVKLERDSTSDRCSNLSEDGSPGDDKLKEALRALKRVTIKQETSLATLRQRSKQRRAEIEQKDKIIRNLKQENDSFRNAHEKLKNNDNGDISELRSRLAQLELQLAKEESAKAEQSKKIKESEAGISNLQAKLVSMKGRGVSRNSSSGSGALSLMSATSSTTSGEDVAKLKKELAKKSEKVANLQHELEVYKDEIFDLKQKKQFSNAFPTTPALGDDDWFDESSDDEGFWGSHNSEF